MTIYINDASTWRTATQISVADPEAELSNVSVGGFSSSYTDSANSLYVWGTNNLGALGLNALNPRSSPTILPGSWKNFSTSGYNSLILTNDNLLFATGQNAEGALGNGTVINRSSPVQIGTSSWSAISANYATSAAIRTDGTLWTWGARKAQGVGDFALSDFSIGNSGGTDTNSVLAIRKSDGTLWAWGRNQTGQLGLGDIISRSSPVQIGLDTNYKSVVTDRQTSFALNVFGSLLGWGDNTGGQLGDGTLISKSSPVLLHSGKNYKIISFCGGTALAIDTNDKLWGWGYNETAKIGDNTIINRSSPVQIGTSNWSTISVGSLSSFGITTDGKLFAWGDNAYYQLGDNTITDRSSPVQVGSPTSWIQVSAGGQHTGAISTANTLYTWGFNSSYELGHLDTSTRQVPTLVTTAAIASNVVFVHCGNQGTSVIIDKGFYTEHYIMGLNGSNFNLGGPTQTTYVVPTAITEDGIRTKVKKINTNSRNAAKLYEDGLYLASGFQQHGEFGINTAGTTHQGYIISLNRFGSVFNNTRLTSSPVQLGTNTAYTSSWAQVSTGYYHFGAIQTDGKLFTWGENEFGQLGNENRFTSGALIPLGTSSWSQVSSGFDHTLAITADGKLFTWGNNTYGQLGDNAVAARSSPIQIGTSKSWTQVSAGHFHSVAKATDGTLWTWGYNLYGQLGDNTVVNKSSPIQIGTSSWNQISAGDYHTFASIGTTTLYGWGENGTGQLGDNTRVNKSSPVLIKSTGTRWITADEVHVNDSGTWRKVFPDGFTYNLTVSANTADFNLRNAMVSSGWDGSSAVNATITVPATFHFYATSTANSGFMCNPALPVGSSVTLNLNGGIWGKGGAGGNSTPGGPGTTASPGSSGGTGLYVRTPGTSPSTEFILNKGPTSRVAGGGGGGAATSNYSFSFFAPPKAGGTRTGFYSGAGGGGGAGFSPASPPGTGAGGVVPAYPFSGGAAGTTSGGFGGTSTFISGTSTSTVSAGQGGGLGANGLVRAPAPQANPFNFGGATGGTGGKAIDGISFINVTANNGTTNGAIT
jgi:alpha-tubulin suppressor-like RCC1 family protein